MDSRNGYCHTRPAFEVFATSKFLHVLISEALDPKLIENQCEAGTFSYDSFFDFMCRILPQLCAPFRDPEVKAFAENKTGDPIDRLLSVDGYY